MDTEKFIDIFAISLELSLQEIEKNHKMNIEEIKKEILDQFKACICGERERIHYDKSIPSEKGGRLSYDCELLNLSGSNEGRKILEQIELAEYCLAAINEFGREDNIQQEKKKIYDTLNADISEVIFKNRTDMMIDSKSWKTLTNDIYDEKDTTDSSNTIDFFIYNDKQIDFLLGNILLRSSFKVEK